MHKRYDLFINTEFFDDPDTQLPIPDVIKIADYQQPAFQDGVSNIKQLLRINEQAELRRAALKIQKIMNNCLFRNFISAWNLIKSKFSNQLIVQSKLFTNQPESFHIQKIKTQERYEFTNQHKMSVQNHSGRLHLKSSNTNPYKSVSLSSGKPPQFTMQAGQIHKINYQRAKVLKNIMQKLKYMNKSKDQIVNYNELSSKILLQGKINRLQNIIENYMSQNGQQRQGSTDRDGNNSHDIRQVQSNKNSSNSQYSNKQSANSHNFKSQHPIKLSTIATDQAQNDSLYQKISQQLAFIRKEVHSLKQENTKIVQLQEKRRQTLTKMQQNQSQSNQQYSYLKDEMFLMFRRNEQEVRRNNQERIKLARLQQGHIYLQRQSNDLKNRLYSMEMSKTQAYRQWQQIAVQTRQYQRTKLNNAAPGNNSSYHQQKQPKAGAYNRQSLIPNPLGYSTFTDSHKDPKDNQMPPKDFERYNNSINPNDWRNRMINPDDQTCC